MSSLEKIQKMLTAASHAAIITSEVNCRYFVEFCAAESYLLVTKEQAYFVVDERYYEKARNEARNCKVLLLNDLQKQLGRLLDEHEITAVSLEYDRITIAEFKRLQRRFKYINFDCSSWLSNNIDLLRAIKTDDEILKITKAQRIAEAAFSKLLSRLCVGMTEKQVAAILNFYMMDLGADGVAFDTIAASGVNSACPHAAPTDKPLAAGDFLTLDFGAVWQGYRSDFARTVVIGRPTDDMKQIYNAVWGANTDVIKAVRTEITGKVLDNVARATLEAWNYEKYFTHGLGHGIGLEVHEPPRISPKSDFTLRENMVITIEPGVYLPGRYGVRIEDMVVVTSSGCRPITEAPKTFIYV